jgi:pentatricopeptide repeat protein
MPQSTPQGPYNDKIKTKIGAKEYEEALAVFEEMTSNSVAPDESTFVLLALAIAHMNPKSSFDYLLKIKGQYSTLSKPQVPVKAGKSILFKLAKSMNTQIEAPRAPRASSPVRLDSKMVTFEETASDYPVPSFFESQNQALTGIFRVWAENHAVDVLLDFLLNHHDKPRVADITLALDQCIKHAKPEEGWKIYNKWKGTCPAPPVFHLATVLNVSQIVPDMAKAIVPEKTTLERLRQVNKDMAEANLMPSYSTQAYLLRHWGAVGRPDFAFKHWENMLKDPSIYDQLRMADYNVILNQYALKKMVPEAEALFASLRTHATLKMDASIYTTMIKVYARVLDTAKAWSLVGEMVRHGCDPAVYARHRGMKKAELDIWPTNITMSILLDMEARANGPLALIETFEAIRSTYHLTPTLNNFGALLEQLAIQKQYIACFDWFVTMMRTQSLRVTVRECCYLTLIDPELAPMTDEERAAIKLRWNTDTEAPPLSNEDRRKWIATVYRWKDRYVRNNTLQPPAELDMLALQRIRDKLADPQPNGANL